MAAGRIKGITIEIGGDSTKLVKALSNVDNAISKTQTNLRDINKALKLDPGNVELIKDKQLELAKQVDSTKERIEKEEQALAELNQKLDEPWDVDHADEFQKNAKAAEELKLQIDLDKAALKDLESQARETSSVFGQQMQIAGDKIKAVGDKIKEVGDKISDMGNTLTQKVTTPIVTAFGASVKSAIDWESAFTGVMKTVDETSTTTYDDLKKNINEIAKTTAASQNEIAGVMEIAGQLGVGADSITGFTKTMVELGDTTNLTAEEAASSIAKFANVTKMSLDDTDRLGSSLVDLGNNFATTESDILSMATRLSGAGAQIGLSQGEILGFATALSSVGIEAEMGGSAFSKAMVKMQVAAETGYEPVLELSEKTGMSLRDLELMSVNNTKDFKALADSLGMTATEMNATIKAGNNLEDFAKVANMSTEQFVNLYRNDAPAALQAFIQGLGDVEGHGESTITMLQEMGFTEVRLRDTLTRLAQSGDLVTEAVNKGNQAWNENKAMTEEANKRYSTMAAKISQTKAALVEVAVSVGETLMPFVEKAVAKIQELADKWKALSPAQQEAILKFAAIAAAVGPVLIVVGKVVSAVGTIISVIGTVVSAIGAAIPVITGIAGVITGTVIPAIAAVVAPILPIIAAIAAVIAIIVLCIKHWDEIKAAAINAVQAMSEAWTRFKESFAKMWTELKDNVHKNLESMVKKWTEFKNNVSQKWNELKANVSKAAQDIANNVSEKFNEMKTKALEKVTNLKENALEIFGNLKEGIKNTVGGIYDAVVEGIGRAVDWIKGLASDAWNWGSDMINGFIDGIKSAVSGIGDAMSGVAETVSSYIHFSEPDIGPLSDASSYMPDFIDLLVKGINQGIPKIENAMNSLSGGMASTLQGGNGLAGSTITNSVNINVYGAQGQNVSELADIIEQRIAEHTIRRGVAGI